MEQLESLSCCNQEKSPWEFWPQWTFRPLKNAKIQTKTHEMEVLEALENETLDSHSRNWRSSPCAPMKNEPYGSFLFSKLAVETFGLPFRLDRRPSPGSGRPR